MVDISRSQSYENPNDFNCKDVRRHNIEGEQSILWPGPRSKIRCEDEKTGLTAPKKLIKMQPNKVFLFSGKHISKAWESNKVVNFKRI
jgi:hypothetical protein